MNCAKIRENFADYLTGSLAEVTLREIRNHLAGCPPCRAEVENLSAIWAKLGVLPQELPSAAVRERFYGTLEASLAEMEGETGRLPLRRRPGEARSVRGLSGHRPFPFRLGYQAGLALALLAVGLGAWFWLGGRRPAVRSEISQLRREVGDLRQAAALSLLRQPASSDRLLAVSLAGNVRQPDRPTVEALVRTLNEDPSVNVRLAAVDALYLFAGQPGVKEELVRALAVQGSPLVQVALIDTLVDVREKRALEALKLLAGNVKLEPAVRRKAESGIRELSL